MNRQLSPATQSSSDEHWMRRALELAVVGQGSVEPNPMVGCVLVRDGVLIGEGFHARFGDPHAEATALANVDDARDATAYVTLEPCCHHGKTPPCADALIAAGVRRVVYAVGDPFPRVDGGGARRLRAARIEVVEGVLRDEAIELLAPYLKRVTTGKPWVIAKWAMSVDGRIATRTGESQWITGPPARVEVHQLRGRVDAIAVGMGTVLADNPRLTVRPAPSETGTLATRVPMRLVFCRRRVPPLESVLVTTSTHVPTAVLAGPRITAADLARLGDHEVDTWQATSDDPVEMVNEALVYLGSDANFRRLPMTNLMVEGGGELLGSFAAADQIDEAHVFLGAKLIGGTTAPGPVGDPGTAHLSDALPLRCIQVDRLSDDVRLIYRRSR